MNAIDQEKLGPLGDAALMKEVKAAEAAGVGEAATEGEVAQAKVEHKREAVAQLEAKLSGVIDTNVELSEDVDAAATELVLDTAMADSTTIAPDVAIVEEKLPGIDKAALAKLGEEAQALAAEVAAHPDDASLKAKAEKFCHDKLGASLADTLQAAGELVIPVADLTSLRKVLSGEGDIREIPKAALGIINPLGLLAVRLVEGDINEGTARKDIQRLALKGRLCSGLAKALAYVVPEAAFVLKPASYVLDGVGKELQRLAVQENITVWDQAKAIVRGLIPADAADRAAVITAIGKAAGNEEMLKTVGLGEDGRTVAKMLASAIEKHPDKIDAVLAKAAGHEQATA